MKRNTRHCFIKLMYNAMKNLIIPILMSILGKLSNIYRVFSGSTVCTVIFNGTKVYCANAGDSRAIKVAVIPSD